MEFVKVVLTRIVQDPENQKWRKLRSPPEYKDILTERFGFTETTDGRVEFTGSAEEAASFLESLHSFAEVVEAVQKGQQLPGIEDVDDSPVFVSLDSFLSERPKKPWEIT